MKFIRITRRAIGVIANPSLWHKGADALAILEELFSSSHEMTEKLNRIEKLAKAPIIGKFKAAKQALYNAKSTDLSNVKRSNEMERAWHLLEECYYELEDLEFMLELRAITAYHVVICHALLGNQTLALDWCEKCRKLANSPEFPFIYLKETQRAIMQNLFFILRSPGNIAYSLQTGALHKALKVKEEYLSAISELETALQQ